MHKISEPKYLDAIRFKNGEIHLIKDADKIQIDTLTCEKANNRWNRTGMTLFMKWAWIKESKGASFLPLKEFPKETRQKIVDEYYRDLVYYRDL